MSDVKEFEHVRTPAAFTTEFIATYLEPHDDIKRALPLKLRVPIEVIGHPGADIDHYVVTTIGWVKTGQLESGVTIVWKPESPASFPTFAGFLFAEPEGEERSTLTLVGTFTPPSGLGGGLFDGAIGAWIARAAAHNLLQRLRDAAEADYARQPRPQKLLN
jgi:hypothetical protein